MLKIIAYISGLIMGLSGELNYEFVYLMLRWKFYKYEGKSPTPTNILQFGTYQHFTPPLPHRYMVLSGAQLSQAFVGWLSKLIGQTITFSDKLHRFGMHKLLLISYYISIATEAPQQW